MKNALIISNSVFDKNQTNRLKENDFSIDNVKPANINDKDLSIYDVVIWGAFNLSKELLQQFSNATLFSFMGTGYSSFIDTDYCNDNGIKISNTPGVNANAVAEFAIGLMLDIKRDITKVNNRLKQGDKSRETKNGFEVRSSTVGIAGFGKIGSRIADICSKGFESKVIYTSRNNKKNEYEFVGKDELLKQSDILFLCMDENKDTINYITENEFNLIKETAFIINTSFPDLINGPDLYNALSNKKIAGCAMDRYYSEFPKCEADKTDYNLLSLSDDVFINTSHIAPKSLDTWDKMDKMVVDNIINFFNGNLDQVNLVN